MSAIHSTGDRLRRATQLWHAFLASTGQRFELALFLKDPAIEKQTLDIALSSSDSKLIALAQDWLRDTAQGPAIVPAAREVRSVSASVAPAPAGGPPGEAAKPSRYLRGVR